MSPKESIADHQHRTQHYLSVGIDPGAFASSDFAIHDRWSDGLLGSEGSGVDVGVSQEGEPLSQMISQCFASLAYSWVECGVSTSACNTSYRRSAYSLNSERVAGPAACSSRKASASGRAG